MASAEQEVQSVEELGNTVVEDGANLGVKRYFTIPGRDPFDEIEWEIRDAFIPGKDKPAFEQKDVEFPKFWSQTATNIVAQKYFRGRMSSPERESSVKQMIGRVVSTVGQWGRDGGYFADEEEAETFEAELKAILVNQLASFNSPVWFNVGFEEKPQCSACQKYDALISTPEGMVPIGELVEGDEVGREVYDSNGTTRIVAVKHNGRKPVRRVTLRNGSFIEATPDHVVKAVDERRTEPSWLRVDQLEPGMRLHLHPHRAKVAQSALVAAGGIALDELPELPETSEEQIVETAEAALAGWLQADGFVGQYETGTNQSLTIEFQVANEDEYGWVVHNLDLALHDVHRHVRDVEGVDGTVSCRRIRLYGEVLRDFVEKWDLLARGTDIRVPARLWTASHDEIAAYLRSIFQADGYVTVRRADGQESGRIAFAVIGERWTEDIQLLLNVMGIYSRRLRKTEKRTDRHDLHEIVISIGSERARFAELIGFAGHDKQRTLLESLELQGLKRCPDLREEAIVSIEDLGVHEVYDIQTESGEYLSNNIAVHNCFILSIEDSMESILDWIRREGVIFRGGSGSGVNLSKLRSSKEQLSKGGYASGPVSFMRGADASAGTIKSGGKTRRAAKMVVLDVDHPDIEEFIWCKAREEEKARVLEQNGYDMSLDSPDWASIQYQNANNSVRVTDAFMEAAAEGREWNLTARTDGTVIESRDARALLKQMAEAAWQCADPGVQYDTTINSWHTLPNTSRINASNPCSEYMSIDDSACNLSSINLMKFRREDGEFDVEAFEHAVDTMFVAQEIMVGYSSYPTPEIEKNAKAYRQLGLGYANLGALLMSRGLPYDSDEGRAYSAAITALLTGRGYRKSAEVAARMGPFAGYRKNAAAMLGVMAKHRAAVGNIEDQDSVPADLLSACRRAWDDALNLGEVHGYRNAQATVLAPTGCLVGDSLVSTNRGLVRLRTLGDPVGEKWQPLELEVATDEGPREATQFYVNGFEQVVSIETGRGYRIQGTPTHRIKVVDEEGNWVWKRFGEIGAGDRVPLMREGMIGEPQVVQLPPIGELYWTADFRTHAPREMTPELAELVGYFMGDGSLHAKGLRFCVAKEDRDVVEHLCDLGSALFGLDAHVTEKKGYTEVALNSVPLVLWWEACGFAKLPPAAEHSGKGWHAHIPDVVLHTNNREVYTAFIRGLFEADGTTNQGYVSWSTITESFSRDVQTLLLALGFVTTRKVDGTSSNWGSHDRFVLRLLNVSAAERYLEEIDFISVRKPARLWKGEHRQAARAARLLLRHGRNRRDARRPADLRHLGARQGHVRGQRLRQPQHHLFHDGLRHDGRRARLLAREVEAARRRRRDHDRQQDRPDGAREARLRAERGGRDRRLRRRAQHRHRRPIRQDRPLPDLRLRDRRASHPLHGPCEDDGRGPALHLRGDLEDGQPARAGHGRRRLAGAPRRVEARRQGDRDLPRQLQGRAAAVRKGQGSGRPARPADAAAAAAGGSRRGRPQVPGRRLRGLHPRRPVRRRDARRHLRRHRQGGDDPRRTDDLVHDLGLRRPAVRRAARGLRLEVQPHALRAVRADERPGHPHREVDRRLHLPLDGEEVPHHRPAGGGRDPVAGGAGAARTGVQRAGGQRRLCRRGRGGAGRGATAGPDRAVQRVGGRGRVLEVRRPDGADGQLLHVSGLRD